MRATIGPEWSDIAPLLDQLEQARREVERLKADVRVAYGFDKEAVFANIDNLTSQVARLRGALEHYMTASMPPRPASARKLDHRRSTGFDAAGD
jgi:hypothetical protein